MPLSTHTGETIVWDGGRVLSDVEQRGWSSAPCPSPLSGFSIHFITCPHTGRSLPRAAGSPGTDIFSWVLGSQVVPTTGRFPQEDGAHLCFLVQSLGGSNIYAAWLHVKWDKEAKMGKKMRKRSNHQLY